VLLSGPRDLLEAGAAVGGGAVGGGSPVEVACVAGDVRMVTLLLRFGAPREGLLDLAQQARQFDMIKLLQGWQQEEGCDAA
jgi:hypothetical protein